MKIITLLTALLLPIMAFTQIDPVIWSFRAEKLSADEYSLIFTAKVDEGWYIYSQHLEEGGPIPTSFTLEEAPHFSLVGETEESSEYRKEGFDELFSMNVVKYAKKAVFTQLVRIQDTSKPIRGSLTFMTCNDDQCLPPKTMRFLIPIVQ